MTECETCAIAIALCMPKNAHRTFYQIGFRTHIATCDRTSQLAEVRPHITSHALVLWSGTHLWSGAHLQSGPTFGQGPPSVLAHLWSGPTFEWGPFLVRPTFRRGPTFSQGPTFKQGPTFGRGPNKEIAFQKWVESIQAAAYNGASTIIFSSFI